jgi:fluoride exporter
MTDALTWIGIGAFGALGAYARFWVGGIVTARRPGPFPFGTFVVNLSGGFALGLLVGLSVTGPALLVLGTGLLGGYTTFSTWMVERTYIVTSIVAGLGVAALGYALGSLL